MSFVLQYLAMDDGGDEAFSAVDVVAYVVGTYKNGDVQIRITDPERENIRNPISVFLRFQLGELVRDATMCETEEE